jgi:uncharacterized protein YndB with AHSA1/START domain
MTELETTAERLVAAPAADVYRYIADYQQHHPHFLPPAFEHFRVARGGVGSGTSFEATVKLGGRRRPLQMEVTEPEPGRVLAETDQETGMRTTFTVQPEGERSRVRITTTWRSAGGLLGFLERRFAPRMLAALFEDELALMDGYAREQAGHPHDVTDNA